MGRLCNRILPSPASLTAADAKARSRWVSRYLGHVGRMPPELRLGSGVLGISSSVLGQGQQRLPPLISGSNWLSADGDTEQLWQTVRGSLFMETKDLGLS